MNTQSQAVIHDIWKQYEQGKSVEVISRKFHLPDSFVRHVIAYGTLPEVQPQWRSSADSAEDESGR